MIDARDVKLAELLVGYSTNVKKGEKVLIEFSGSECIPLVKQIIREVYKKGGMAFTRFGDASVTRELLLGASEEQLKLMEKHNLAFIKDMDAFIGIRGGDNNNELSDVPQEQMSMYESITLESQEERVNNTKWVILKYPNGSMAQLMNTSKEGFEKFFYDVCTMDYAAMNKAMDNLKDLMDRTDKVRLTAEGTDLTFSIKGIQAIKCAGECNIPDGEVYTAPVRDSMNGVISYNAPSVIQGFTYENVRFEIENGKIVKATANDTERINKYLDTDEGARYFGEFAIGVNPYILEPMKDILFDEKITGSIHLTPGMCYEDASNGNHSAIHWDLVLIQRPEYGGGEIWFDDVLIRKDGLFVLPELEALNPENLK